MAIKFPDRLESNNPKSFGIVRGSQISGHKTVLNFTKLYSIADCILSESGTNENQDAIGQEWYVLSEGKKYVLIDWENRRNSDGWEEFSRVDISSDIQAGDGIIVTVVIDEEGKKRVTISAIPEIDDTLNASPVRTWSIDKLKNVISQGRGLKLVNKETETGEETLVLETNVDNESIGINPEDAMYVIGVDGGTYN